MQDIFKTIEPWAEGDQPFALATVVRTWRSAPRQAGSAMAVTPDLQVVGSVSGGCIEGAVIEEAREVIASGVPRVLTFGVEDESAWSVGLSCGGKVKVFVERSMAFDDRPEERSVWSALGRAIRENRPAVLLARMGGDRSSHLLVYPDGSTVGGFEAATEAAVEAALAAYADRENREVELAGEPVFIQVFPRKDQLLIIGAAHATLSLVAFARQLRFETIVVDPRRVFSNVSRFPAPPDRLLQAWPQEVLPGLGLTEDTYAVLLTHDPKIDDPALHILLRSPVAYIGALGSRRTQEKRQERLRKQGFTEAEIGRIHGPVGLDIGAETPDEIALSVIAEVVRAKHERRA